MSNSFRAIATFLLSLCMVQATLVTIASAPAAAQEEPAAEPAAEPGGEGEEVKPSKSRFMWFIYSSGFIGLFILCLSIYFVATVIRLFIELRSVVAMPPDEVAQCEQFLTARDYQGLYDYASKS